MVSLTFHPSGFSGKMLTTEQDDDQEHRRDRGRATDNLNPDHRDATPIPGMETLSSRKFDEKEKVNSSGEFFSFSFHFFKFPRLLIGGFRRLKSDLRRLT